MSAHIHPQPPTKDTHTADQDLAHLDEDYDQVVDEDWVDMVPSTTHPHIHHGTHTVPSTTTSDNPTSSSSSSPTSSSLPQLTVSTTASNPSLSTADLIADDVPGSASSSSSEYSLLNPLSASADQSRKNSLSSISEIHMTPTEPLTAHDGPSSSLDDTALGRGDAHTAVASPSFSDFVKVGSDTGEDTFGVESTSGRSSNGNSDKEKDGQTSSPRGPQGVATLFKDDEVLSSTDHQDDQVAPTSESTRDTVPSMSTAGRRTYRTQLEDAVSSDEDRSSQPQEGLRHRHPQALPEEDDIRRSFYSSTARTTMPGGLNLGLDAALQETPETATRSTAAALEEIPVEERQCRICLGGADEEDTLGRLISPCLCKGSMKYVHVECLNAWRARSPKRESHYKCDTCKYSFSFRRTSLARYLGHPITVFVLTLVVFALAVFVAGFAMKLLLYLLVDEPLIYPVDLDDYDEEELAQLQEQVVIFKPPESLRAVFSIDQTHMVFGSFLVSIVGFLQLMFSTLLMGGGGGIIRIGGFGLGGGGGRRRGGRGERQGEAGIGGVVMVLILVFGLFKSVYTTYQIVNKVSRRVLAKAEMMVLEVQ